MNWSPPSPKNEVLCRLDELGFVGFWHCDFRTGRFDASCSMARYFGLGSSADEVNTLQLSDFEKRIFEGDKERLRGWRTDAAKRGGVSNIEYRIVDGKGNLRRALCQSSYRMDRNGDIVEGEGMLFDITDTKLGGCALPSGERVLQPIERLADILLQAHKLVLETGHPHIRDLIERALLETGWALANDQEPPPTKAHH